MTDRLDVYINAPLPIERELRLLFRRDERITIFDIGACEGEDSVRYARRFPHSTVYAVEPLPANVERIEATIARYGTTNVRVLPIALSDLSGKAKMFVSAGRPPAVPASDDWDYGNKSSSLLEPDRHLEIVPWLHFDDVMEVETRTMADVCASNAIQRVDFIHMDVQGAELKVLDGLGPLLERVTAIWLEVEAVPLYRDQPLKDDVAQYLRARGFEMLKDTVDDISGDQLWVHKRGMVRRARLGDATRKTRAVLNVTDPVVSVVLPVYNCAGYVGEAVGSILGQTYTDLELIVIDDGSEDETPTVLRAFDDPRVRVVRRPHQGIAVARNHGIGLSRGRYIAQMDADDMSRPGRIASQVAFLDANPGCGMVGTWAEIWSGREKTQRVHAHPVENAHLKFELLLNNPFVQSSVMVRREVLDQVGLYSTDSARQPPEDFELWSRIARQFEVANIPELLHVYREIQGSVSRSGPSPFIDHIVTICAENLSWAVGLEPSNPHVVNIAALVHNADHRVQGRPDFAEMRQILAQAATRVAPGESQRFAIAAQQLIDSLRHGFWARRYGHGWRLQVARVNYRIARLTKGS